MTPELAGHRLWFLRRAWSGATACRDRHLAAIAAAPVLPISTFAPVTDLRGLPFHDLDYYAWEAARIIKIAVKVKKAGLDGDAIEAALAALTDCSPGLLDYRHAATHPEDNRANDDVMLGSSAVRLGPNMRVEYVLDPRHATHDALERLVEVTERALRRIAPPDDGSLPRYDNSGR